MKKLASPQLDWKDNKTPVSGRFDDVYFSVDDGLAESMYVFVNGCGMPDAFHCHDIFNICETGFGTGLNFLLSWKAWRESGTSCQMNYYSLEAFPLTLDQLRDAYKNFPELEEYGDAFLECYPALSHGFHHIALEGGKVRLTLMFGEAADMLSQMEGEINAWYLDGFAPAKNPEMWRAEVFEQMGRLSAKGAVVSTFTSAGFVKRGLRDVGFEMTKRRGYGRKRESLIGTFQHGDLKKNAPWFDKPKRAFKAQKIAVVGAGIAGCATAYRLKQDGHDVTLFDRNKQAGSEGSGNRLGLIKPRLTLEGQFNVRTFLQAITFYDRLGEGIWQGERGLFQMEQDGADHLKFKTLMEREILPAGHMELLDAQQASNRLGVQVERGGLWFNRAGYVEPSALCDFLSRDIAQQFGCQIDRLHNENGLWQLFSGEQIVFEGDVVVLASAGETTALNPYSEMPMRGRRGQVSYLSAEKAALGLTVPLSCGGYFLPERDGIHIAGATFDRWEDFFDRSYRDVTTQSHEKNVNRVLGYFPDLPIEVLDGRASIRAMTPDHMPIVGPIHDDAQYKDLYANLRHGPRNRNFEPAQYVDGLYTICGLGARGVQTAPLMADVLASYISGAPCPIENEFREMVHPARFLVRDIRKAKI